MFCLTFNHIYLKTKNILNLSIDIGADSWSLNSSDSDIVLKSIRGDASSNHVVVQKIGEKVSISQKTV